MHFSELVRFADCLGLFGGIECILFHLTCVNIMLGSTDLDWGCWQFVSFLVYRHAWLSESVNLSQYSFIYISTRSQSAHANLELLLQLACGVFGLYLLSGLATDDCGLQLALTWR